MNEPEMTQEEIRKAIEEATARRIASYSEFSLGPIRANRSIPIRSRRHSISHKAIGSFA